MLQVPLETSIVHSLRMKMQTAPLSASAAALGLSLFLAGCSGGGASWGGG